jgi:transposase-like protein
VVSGKRHTTEDKIRILREADSGRNIVEICREKNISEDNVRDVSHILSGLAAGGLTANPNP